eukprot:1776190-Prymnesium_polylepis.2
MAYSLTSAAFLPNFAWAFLPNYRQGYTYESAKLRQSLLASYDTRSPPLSNRTADYSAAGADVALQDNTPPHSVGDRCGDG